MTRPPGEPRSRTLAPSRRAAALVAAIALGACADRPQGSTGAPDEAGVDGAPAGSAGAPVYFVDVGAELGLEFEHRDGRSGRRYYVETASGGGGFLDADGDGRLDVYLINGAASPGSDLPETPRNALYLQRDGHFENVGTAAGVADDGFGMGLCAADLDGEGGLDFLVTNYGADRLYHHRGLVDGVPRYEEIAREAGLEGDRWGTGCAFGDLDGDGDLDLYIANYIDFRYQRYPTCGDAARGISSYCRPSVYAGQPDQLYINQGSGDGSSPPLRFREEGALRGILQGREDKGFGVVLSDVDGDGDLDILVANDGTPNRLYLNDGHAFFTERGLESGFALDRDGHAGSGMGLDVADADGDGHLDAIVTNYAHEGHTLLLGRAGARFADRTAEWDLLRPSFLVVGWGARFFDAENDGDLDLAVANGHVMDNIELFEPTASYPQPDHLFLHEGARFRRATAPGPGFTDSTARVSRALATGDFDNDGRIDLLVTSTNDSPRLLRNVSAAELPSAAAGRWLGLQLHGVAPNRSAIGARVTLTRLDADGSGYGADSPEPLGIAEVRSGGSLMAQSDLRLHFGLGAENGSVAVDIAWPDGSRSRHKVSDLDRYHQLHHPAGTAEPGR